MNRFTLTMLAAIALWACNSQASDTRQTAPTVSASDQQAMRAVVDKFADSWNHHDMHEMHDIDTNNVWWLDGTGHVWKGKDTTVRGHTAFHKVLAAKQTMSVESVEFHDITRDVAVAMAIMHFSVLQTADGHDYGTPAKTRGSFTMIKRGGTWKIVHFQNTIIDPQLENVDLPSQAELPPDFKGKNR